MFLLFLLLPYEKYAKGIELNGMKNGGNTLLFTKRVEVNSDIDFSDICKTDIHCFFKCR